MSRSTTRMLPLHEHSVLHLRTPKTSVIDFWNLHEACATMPHRHEIVGEYDFRAFTCKELLLDYRHHRFTFYVPMGLDQSISRCGWPFHARNPDHKIHFQYPFHEWKYYDHDIHYSTSWKNDDVLIKSDRSLLTFWMVALILITVDIVCILIMTPLNNTRLNGHTKMHQTDKIITFSVPGTH